MPKPFGRYDPSNPMNPPGNPVSKRAAKFVLNNCTLACSINPANLPNNMGALVHAWFEAGDSNVKMIEKAAALDVKLSNGSLGRHRQRHLVRSDGAFNQPLKASEKKTDLEVLEIIIGRGSQQVDLATTKISAEQLLRAIELKHKLTEGSVFESLFGALVEEGDAAFAGGPESPEAVASAEEQAQSQEPA